MPMHVELGDDNVAVTEPMADESAEAKQMHAAFEDTPTPKVEVDETPAAEPAEARARALLMYNTPSVVRMHIPLYSVSIGTSHRLQRERRQLSKFRRS
jgi:hypothetical protein